MTKKQGDLPRLPRGWVWTDTGSLSWFVTSGSRNWKKYYSGSGALFIRTQDIRMNRLSLENRVFVKLPEKVEGKRSLVEKNDLLVGITGHVGKVALVDRHIGEAYVSQSVALMKLVLPEIGGFVHLAMITDGFGKTQLEKMVYGMGRPVLNLQNIRNVMIPLPPLAEQGRITSRIEELFSRLDAGVESLRKVKAQLKRYRQAVWKYAFEGKLTEEWRETHKDQIEPAIELLERVKQKEARNQEPLPIEESDLFTLPEDWAWTAFGEISQIKMGQSPSGSSYNNSGQGTALLNGPTEFGEEHPIAVQWTTSPTKICKKGDLLICVRGNTTGRMNWADQEYCIGRGLAAITPLENIVKRELLFSFLLMKVEEIMRRTRGSTFPNLKSDELHKFPFPLAAYTEQEELVARMREAFSAARELERNMATSLSQSERLRQSILKAAFEGKLVPQDPSDEPAERLLERVKAERAKSKGEKDTNSKNKSQLELSTYVK